MNSLPRVGVCYSRHSRVSGLKSLTGKPANSFRWLKAVSQLLPGPGAEKSLSWRKTSFSGKWFIICEPCAFFSWATRITRGDFGLNDLLKNVLLWVVIAVILVAVFNNLGGQAQVGTPISYSEFINEVKSGQIQTANIAGREITGRNSTGVYSTYSPETDNRSLIGDLLDAGCLLYTSPSPRDRG